MMADVRDYRVDLPREVKEVIAYTASQWPKTLDSRALLAELHALAVRVYVLTQQLTDKEPWR